MGSSRIVSPSSALFRQSFWKLKLSADSWPVPKGAGYFFFLGSVLEMFEVKGLGSVCWTGLDVLVVQERSNVFLHVVCRELVSLY